MNSGMNGISKSKGVRKSYSLVTIIASITKYKVKLIIPNNNKYLALACVDNSNP